MNLRIGVGTIRQRAGTTSDDELSAGRSVESLSIREHRRLELTGHTWITIILLCILAGAIFAPMIGLISGRIALAELERIYLVLIPSLVSLLTATAYLRGR